MSAERACGRRRRASAVAAPALSDSLTGRAADYRRFQEALVVPLGYRAGRLELDKTNPDLRLVEAHWLTGENAPEDIPGQDPAVPLLPQRPVHGRGGRRPGSKATGLIEQLQALGLAHPPARRARRQAGGAAAGCSTTWTRWTTRFVSVEKYFSATLGRASRETERLLVAVTVTLGRAARAGRRLVRAARDAPADGRSPAAGSTPTIAGTWRPTRPASACSTGTSRRTA